MNTTQRTCLYPHQETDKRFEPEQQITQFNLGSLLTSWNELNKLHVLFVAFSVHLS